MDEKYFKTLIARYLEKKATDEELMAFIQLLKEGKLDHFIKEAMDEELRTPDDKS